MRSLIVSCALRQPLKEDLKHPESFDSPEHAVIKGLVEFVAVIDSHADKNEREYDDAQPGTDYSIGNRDTAAGRAPVGLKNGS